MRVALEQIREITGLKVARKDAKNRQHTSNNTFLQYQQSPVCKVTKVSNR